MDASVCPNYFSTKMQTQALMHESVSFCPQFPTCCALRRKMKRMRVRILDLLVPSFPKASNQENDMQLLLQQDQKKPTDSCVFVHMYFLKQVYSSDFRFQRPDVGDNRNSHMYWRESLKKEEGGVLPAENMFSFFKIINDRILHKRNHSKILKSTRSWFKNKPVESQIERIRGY